MAVVYSDLPVRAHGSSAPASQAARTAYLLALLVTVAGWALNARYTSLVDPENGLGYWLGIVGASMMGLLLLYPVRKRVRFMRVLGATRHWFRMHMVLGVLGPLLILYHCNFSLGSLNSNVALTCTLLVALSGLVGRYLYTRIYADLDGHKASLRELTQRARLRAGSNYRAAMLLPELLERMRAFDKSVTAPSESLAATLLLPLMLAFRSRIETVRLVWFASRQLRYLARRSPVVAAERRRLRRSIIRFIREHQRRIRRVAAFGSYERLFSLWHVFHLPFFYMLVFTALLHVLAVHMY